MKGQSAEDRLKPRQQVAEDLHDLIERFADHAGLCDRPTYKAMVTIFEQQCEIVGSKVQVRAKTGGACMQYPSDPEAIYDAHKGQAYKVHLSETGSDENDVQLIVMALPQTAAIPDSDALEEVLDDLKEKEHLPAVMTADTAYGGGGNERKVAEKGGELVSPVAGPKGEATPEVASEDKGTKLPSNENATASSTEPVPQAMEPLTIDDFAADELTGKATACPSGRIPLQTIHDAETGKTTIEMRGTDCENCEFRSACPIKKKPGGHDRLTYTEKQHHLEERRQEETTDVFKQQYAKRSEIESTNSGLKRRLGLGKLRGRGRKAVFHALYLKVAGWNLLRAASSGRLAVAGKGLLVPARWFWLIWTAGLTRIRGSGSIDHHEG